MTTTMKIVLDDAQLLALGQRLTGKKHKATRKQVLDWAQQLLDSDLEQTHLMRRVRELRRPRRPAVPWFAGSGGTVGPSRTTK